MKTVAKLTTKQDQMRWEETQESTQVTPGIPHQIPPSSHKQVYRFPHPVSPFPVKGSKNVLVIFIQDSCNKEPEPQTSQDMLCGEIVGEVVGDKVVGVVGKVVGVIPVCGEEVSMPPVACGDERLMVPQTTELFMASAMRSCAFILSSASRNR